MAKKGNRARGKKAKNSPQTNTKRILDAWNMFEENDPDISTERLLAMVSDFTGADIDLVSEVIFTASMEDSGE